MEPRIKLNGWMTIAAMAQKQNCSTQNISKKVRLGTVESRTIAELNNLTLVREKGGERGN